jgi:membrane protein involved in colicin uptake
LNLHHHLRRENMRTKPSVILFALITMAGTQVQAQQMPGYGASNYSGMYGPTPYSGASAISRNPTQDIMRQQYQAAMHKRMQEMRQQYSTPEVTRPEVDTQRNVQTEQRIAAMNERMQQMQNEMQKMQKRMDMMYDQAIEAMKTLQAEQESNKKALAEQIARAVQEAQAERDARAAQAEKARQEAMAAHQARAAQAAKAREEAMAAQQARAAQVAKSAEEARAAHGTQAPQSSQTVQPPQSN